MHRPRKCLGVRRCGPFRQSNRFVSIVITTHAVRQVRYKYILIDGNFFIWCCTMERRQGTPLMSHHHGRRLPPLAMHDLSLIVDFGNFVSSVWRRPLGRPPRLDLEGIKLVDFLQRQACTVEGGISGQRFARLVPCEREHTFGFR
jgi:hypothetical protein